MSNIVVDSFVSKFKFDLNQRELDKARNSVDLMKKATKALEDEQKKQAKASIEAREQLRDLKVALDNGILSKKDFRKKTTQVRTALMDEAIEAKRTTTALKMLKTAEREAAAAARENAKAQRQAAQETERAGKAYEGAQRKAFGAAGAGKSGPRRIGSLGGEVSPYANKSKSFGQRLGAGLRSTMASGNKRAGSFASNVASTAGGNLMSGAVTSVVSGIGDAFRGSISSAVQFESAMADVAKVVDGLKTPTGQATAEYTKLSEELKTLSTRIAVTPVGLADMAAAAGSAGIKGAELSRFVEDAAKTMVAFDITSDEAGNGLAKLRANLGLNQDEVMGLAGTMNHLSNSMASTAAEVLDATLRVGAVGKAANISGQEVAGLTSAMISAGATSEIAATGTKNFILAMAAGESATKRQRAAFAKLGLSADDVAKQFTGTAEQRMNVSRRLLENLGKLDNAQKASTTMQLFGRESLGPIAALTTNVKAFEEAMGFAKDQVAGASSVQKEYDVRSKTTANALQLLQNRFSIIGVEIGEGMMPALNQVVVELGEFLGASKEAGKGIGEVLGNGLIKAWQALRDFLGPADELPGKLQAIMDKVASVASAVFTLVTAVGSLIVKVTESPAGFAVMGAAIAALLGPIGLVTAALVAMNALMDEAGQDMEGQMAAGFFAGGANDKGSLAANQQAWMEHKLKNPSDKKLRGADDDDWERKHLKSGTGLDAGRNSLLGESAERGGIVPMAQKQKAKSTTSGVDMEAFNQRAKLRKFKDLDRRRKHLKPTEKTEYDKLSKELDIAKTTGSGRAKGPPKHKPDSAFEKDVEGEIDRLSEEAGKREGIKQAMAGKSRREQYEAAATTKAITQKTLRDKVDSGGTLPGNFHHNLLQSAGFGDVAGRGTPPPIAVSIIDVKPMNVHVEFSGPVESDPRMVREGVVRVLREEIPRQIAAGMREARSPVVY